MIRAIRCLATLLFATATLAAGDLTLTFQSKTGKKEGLQTQYYSATHHRTNDEGTKTDHLVDYQTLTSYTIDHGRKTIQKLTFDDAIALMESMKAQMPEGMGAMLGGLLGGGGECKVEEVGTEVIAGRTCKKFRITSGKIVFESSNDPSLKPPVAAVAYAKMIKMRGALSAAMGPMGESMKKLYEEMSKIKGLALKTSLKGFMGMSTSTEATKVVEGPVPSSVFALPTGYKVEDMAKQLKQN